MIYIVKVVYIEVFKVTIDFMEKSILNFHVDYWNISLYCYLCGVYQNEHAMHCFDVVINHCVVIIIIIIIIIITIMIIIIMIMIIRAERQ